MPSQGVTNVANAIINKINNLISSHNSNENAHQDIRESIPSATSELNNNSGFITSSSVPTIIDNLTTNDATKALSAKQGKVLNDMIGDAIEYINQ